MGGKTKTGMDLIKMTYMSKKTKLSANNLALRYTPQSMDVAYEFGRWKVDKNGNMEFNCRYYIGNDRLKEDDWVSHLFEKGWIDWNEFIPAFFTACKINKIEHVTLRVFYKSALTE
jgi:hypothetical protein